MDARETVDSPTCAIVDLGAFRHNLDAVRSYVGPSVKIMAVVKANGYGHGMIEMACAAVRWGVDYLAVARVHEGIELRNAGILHPTLVFEALSADLIEPALHHSLHLTVVEWSAAEAIAECAGRLGVRANVHVKVDTGMARLGVQYQEAAAVIERVSTLKNLILDGVYSHFATSEDADRGFAEEQIARFETVLQDVRARGVSIPLRHMANSGAIISLPEASFNMVRPGIMLYGYPPAKGMQERYPVRPVLALKSRIAFLKSVGPGVSISYGRRYFTNDTTVIATIPAGYADGYSRLLTNQAEALVRGERFPIVGTICMDQLMLDLGRNANVAVGDEVTLIGRDGSQVITAWDTATRIGTIPYEITCLITQRVRRIYLE